MQAGDQATGLQARVSLGGAGHASVSTGLSVLDHLLELLATHAGFDLQLEVAPGGPDAEANAAGRALGQELRDILRADGATGWGSASLPAISRTSRSRPDRLLLVANVDFGRARGGLDRDLVRASARLPSCRLTLHVRLLHGEDARHVLEAIFKALGGALAAASAPRAE
jgi:imidazoleglycerol-phosphate dehydratase